MMTKPPDMPPASSAGEKNESVKPLVRADDLAKTFAVRGAAFGKKPPPVRAVSGVSLSVYPAEALCVVGESGCGKSTLARMIIGLAKPDRGRVFYGGERVDNLSEKARRVFRRKMQMIFQNPFASLNPRITVGGALSEALRFHFPQTTPNAARDEVVRALTAAGLAADAATRYPHQFSGGQRQRVSIARALIVRPRFVIADEPIAALDVSVQAQILNLLIDLQESRGLSYLFITHDLSVVEHFGHRVAVMYLGALAEVASCRVLFSRPRHPYTRILLDAVPRIGGNPAKPAANDAAPPPPAGCAFYPRCPSAFPRCQREKPLLHKTPNGAIVACHAVEEGKI
jgi:peptide/nickel transport system ATP-binding protein